MGKNIILSLMNIYILTFLTKMENSAIMISFPYITNKGKFFIKKKTQDSELHFPLVSHIFLANQTEPKQKFEVPSAIMSHTITKSMLQPTRPSKSIGSKSHALFPKQYQTTNQKFYLLSRQK